MNDTTSPIDDTTPIPNDVSLPCAAVEDAALRLKRQRRRWTALMLAMSVWTFWPMLLCVLMPWDTPVGGRRWAISSWAGGLGAFLYLAYVPVGIVTSIVMMTYAGRTESWWRVLIASVMCILLFCAGFVGFGCLMFTSISVAEDYIRAGGRTYGLVSEQGGFPTPGSDNRESATFVIRRGGVPGLGYVRPVQEVYLDCPVFMAIPERLRGKGKGFVAAPGGEVMYLDAHGRCHFVYDPAERKLYGSSDRDGDASMIDRYGHVKEVSMFILLEPGEVISPEEATRLRQYAKTSTFPNSGIVFANVLRDDAENHPSAQVRELAAELLALRNARP